MTREIAIFSLDGIISAGDRAIPQRATQFRKKATQRLREYSVMGFAIEPSGGGHEVRRLQLRRPAAGSGRA